GGTGAVEQQAIQHFARIDDDGAVEMEKGALAGAGNELALADELFGLRAFAEEGIGAEGFLGEAAATGLFPGEMLVVDGNAETCGGQTLAAEGSGRASTHDGDISHERDGLRRAERLPPGTKRRV